MDFKSQIEEWKDIPGFINYQASNLGNVRNKKTKLVLKPNKNAKGYRHVSLSLGSRKDKRLIGVHRAVALAWIPTNDKSLTVNHKDNNPDNNNILNLEWMSNSDNVRYSQGKKIVCNETRVIYDSIWEASRSTGIACATIRRNLKNNYERTRRSKYTWSYA